MPFLMKIQPIDSFTDSVRDEPGKPVLKSRLKRLFDRQFPSVLKPERIIPAAETHESEPSSVGLDRMVQNYMEDCSEKQKCGRNRYNCFNGNNNSSDEDEFDVLNAFGEFVQSVSPTGDACEMLKCLTACTGAKERNLLADASRIVEKNKFCKRKDDLRGIVRDGLSTLSYDVSICKSRWEKSASYLAGEYEFIDVIVEGEAFLIDIDFKSEFEIARPTGFYKMIIQTLPYIFVGKMDRLRLIVPIVSEAAMQSLQKKKMHVPPWRKTEYMQAKWLSASTRIPTTNSLSPDTSSQSDNVKIGNPDSRSHGGDLERISSDQLSLPGANNLESQSLPPPPSVAINQKSASSPTLSTIIGEEMTATPVVASPWQPPAVKPKSFEKGAKVVTGLASLLKEKP